MDNNNIEALVISRQNIKVQIDMLEQEKKAIDEELKSLLTFGKYKIAGFHVSHTQREERRVKSDLLKKRYPDVYGDCSYQMVVDRIEIRPIQITTHELIKAANKGTKE